MSRHKSLHKAIKARSAELDAANAELSTSQAALRAAEDTLRSREATLSELRSEYEMRAGSTDRGVIALRAELRALQEGVAAALAARAAAEARRAALEESVRWFEGGVRRRAINSTVLRPCQRGHHPHAIPTRDCLAERTGRRGAHARDGRHDSGCAKARDGRR